MYGCWCVWVLVCMGVGVYGCVEVCRGVYRCVEVLGCMGAGLEFVFIVRKLESYLIQDFMFPSPVNAPYYPRITSRLYKCCL